MGEILQNFSSLILRGPTQALKICSIKRTPHLLNIILYIHIQYRIIYPICDDCSAQPSWRKTKINRIKNPITLKKCNSKSFQLKLQWIRTASAVGVLAASTQALLTAFFCCFYSRFCSIVHETTVSANRIWREEEKPFKNNPEGYTI